MNKFILYWKDIEIGILTKTNWDMRSGGNILFKFKYQEELKKNNHLSNYIVHSIQAGIYLENGDDKNYEKMCLEETKFLDLINSSEWRIENAERESIRILCPIFIENNMITWQRHYESD